MRAIFVCICSSSLLCSSTWLFLRLLMLLLLFGSVSAVDSQRRCPGSRSSNTIWWRRQVCSQSCPQYSCRICHYLKRNSVSLRVPAWIIRNNDVMDLSWQNIACLIRAADWMQIKSFLKLCIKGLNIILHCRMHLLNWIRIYGLLVKLFAWIRWKIM